MDLYLGSDMDNPRGFYCDLSSNTIYMFLAAKKITSLNGSNGEVVRDFFPEEDEIFLDDWSSPPWSWTFRWPDFRKLNEGPAPIAADDKHYVSRGKLLVMSNSRDEFGVYDPVNFKVLDAFRICQNTQYVTRIDPQERWAAVVCTGHPMDTQLKPGQVPDGAGIAIVELDRYR